jgi:hypothetical protein
VRKATLERILGPAEPGIRFNEQLDEEDGPLVFENLQARAWAFETHNVKRVIPILLQCQ